MRHPWKKADKRDQKDRNSSRGTTNGSMEDATPRKKNRGDIETELEEEIARPRRR